MMYDDEAIVKKHDTSLHTRDTSCRMPGSHEHVRYWGALRRCRIRDCIQAFTTEPYCGNCGFPTHKIRTNE